MEDELQGNPTESVPGGAGVTPAEGDVNAVVSDNTSVSLKDLLKEATGRDYKSDEDALKSIKDTYSYVGKAGQKTTQTSTPVDTSKFVPLERYEEDTFFSKHQELQPYKDVVSSIAKDKGISLEEAIKTESFNNLYSKAKIADEIESSKSVLVSNPRLGKIRDDASAAIEAAKTGDIKSAETLAVRAVLEQMNMPR